MFKKELIALLFLLSFVSTSYGQANTTKVRSAASLPAACTPGSPNVDADTIVVGNVGYVCIALNTWSRIPWADVTAFGARPPTGGLPVLSGTCARGSKNITSVSGANWGNQTIVGDG